MAKTACPIERVEFKQNAKPVVFEIAGTPVTADPREFSTGSFGWYFTGKVSIEVNGKKFNGTMIPLNTLSDFEIANALTYVRNSFGNSGDAINPDEVKRIRSTLPKPVANQFE